MLNLVLLFVTFFLFSCTSPAIYSWQDIREPAREDATVDLEECRSYAARQYRPGMPSGEPYLTTQSESASEFTGNVHGEWRPDRDPFKDTNTNSMPVHDVPVEYTGYPGELDYHPEYLDDILEKCMSDRGWEFRPLQDNPQE